ncbi:hypothetical protein SCHPADRAFT_900313 [Schizopora paradoxa]|uniref:Uncharacterized protein n=1 Tax=Schizopora paradoxa TaxID=27342 RepID=A0A0H2S182_9AGAM|nr:hypothetical protein SCHPADRAFT_900313 [Schizopora paradoxa]
MQYPHGRPIAMCDVQNVRFLVILHAGSNRGPWPYASSNLGFLSAGRGNVEALPSVQTNAASEDSKIKWETIPWVSNMLLVALTWRRPPAGSSARSPFAGLDLDSNESTRGSECHCDPDIGSRCFSLGKMIYGGPPFLAWKFLCLTFGLLLLAQY